MVPGNAGACCWRPTLSTSWTAFSNRSPTRFGTFTRSTEAPARCLAGGAFCATDDEELVLFEGPDDPHPAATQAETTRSTNGALRIGRFTRPLYPALGSCRPVPPRARPGRRSPPSRRPAAGSECAIRVLAGYRAHDRGGR